MPNHIKRVVFRGESLSYRQIAEVAGVSHHFVATVGRRHEDVTELIEARVARMEERACVSLPGEEWRAIKGYPGQEVSSFGRVRTRLFVGRRKGFADTWRLLIAFPDKRYGYLKVGLRQNGVTKQVMVHHLVAEAFHGRRPKGNVARHYPDPDKRNCRADNVRWGTHQQNADDSREQGLLAAGERSGNAKLTDADVLAILIHRGFVSANSLAETFDVTDKHVREIWQGKTRACATRPLAVTRESAPANDNQIELVARVGGRHG